MDKIDLTKIRAEWQTLSTDINTISGGDDTLKSIRMVAEKINEIIDFLNK